MRGPARTPLPHSPSRQWFNYIVETFSNSFYGVATSSDPAGPFTVVNHNVALQFTDNGDEGLFVDDDGTAYVIYTTLSHGHSISIERLSDNYTTSLGAAASSGLFGQSFVEAPALFKRKGIYYATFGSCWCVACFGYRARQRLLAKRVTRHVVHSVSMLAGEPSPPQPPPMPPPPPSPFPAAATAEAARR